MLIKIVHSALFYILVLAGFLVGAISALVLLPFSKSKTGPFQSTAHLWARFLVFCSGVKVKVSGLENIPRDKAVIFAANHQGAADILIVLAFLPVCFRFAIKKELFNIPMFGWYIRKAGYFSIDRSMVLSAYRTLGTIAEILKDGESVLVFPEGTRTKTGELGKFKRGSLLAALKSGAPIVPVAISGSFNLMPRGTWLLSPSPVKFSIGTPIYINTEADYDNKVGEVRNAIAKML